MMMIVITINMEYVRSIFFKGDLNNLSYYSRNSLLPIFPNTFYRTLSLYLITMIKLLTSFRDRFNNIATTQEMNLPNLPLLIIFDYPTKNLGNIFFLKYLL